MRRDEESAHGSYNSEDARRARRRRQSRMDRRSCNTLKGSNGGHAACLAIACRHSPIPTHRVQIADGSLSTKQDARSGLPYPYSQLHKAGIEFSNSHCATHRGPVRSIIKHSHPPCMRLAYPLLQFAVPCPLRVPYSLYRNPGDPEPSLLPLVHDSSHIPTQSPEIYCRRRDPRAPFRALR